MAEVLRPIDINYFLPAPAIDMLRYAVEHPEIPAVLLPEQNLYNQRPFDVIIYGVAQEHGIVLHERSDLLSTRVSDHIAGMRSIIRLLGSVINKQLVEPEYGTIYQQYFMDPDVYKDIQRRITFSNGGKDIMRKAGFLPQEKTPAIFGSISGVLMSFPVWSLYTQSPDAVSKYRANGVPISDFNLMPSPISTYTEWLATLAIKTLSKRFITPVDMLPGDQRLVHPSNSSSATGIFYDSLRNAGLLQT